LYRPPLPDAACQRRRAWRVSTFTVSYSWTTLFNPPNLYENIGPIFMRAGPIYVRIYSKHTCHFS
jgi:hypothetical protein